MPGFAVHLELAARVMRSWRDRSTGPPFPLDDSACRDAFLFGSLAPDLGYFPGGDRLLSDLAHYVRPAELARNLVALAQTNADRALAWGWATHVLADVWIHPLINQAARESVEGRRLPGLAYADDPVTHIRVEAGLDAALPARAGWPEPAAIGRAPGPHAFAPLAEAYRRTYGLAPSCARLFRIHRLAIGLIPVLLLGGRLIGGRASNRLGHWAHRLLAPTTRSRRRVTFVAAFFSPLPPPEWLLDETSAVVDDYPERFQPCFTAQLAGLPDYNLDTGDVETEPPSYALSTATLEMLGRRVASRGRVPS